MPTDVRPTRRLVVAFATAAAALTVYGIVRFASYTGPGLGPDDSFFVGAVGFVLLLGTLTLATVRLHAGARPCDHRRPRLLVSLVPVGLLAAALIESALNAVGIYW